jgi:hypothetical protein
MADGVALADGAEDVSGAVDAGGADAPGAPSHREGEPLPHPAVSTANDAHSAMTVNVTNRARDRRPVTHDGAVTALILAHRPGGRTPGCGVVEIVADM